MGDFSQVDNYGFDFQPLQGNQLLQQEAYTNQNFLQDRPEAISMGVFEEGKPEMYNKKDFDEKPRNILTGYRSFDYFYNPATSIYNKSLK